MIAERKRDSAQEQFVEARRSQILDAATTVFAAKGFERATIRDIAKTAGVADGTIYNYFENKMAIMLGIVNRLNESDRREEDLRQIEGMDTRTFTRRYIAHRLGMFTGKELELFQVVIAEVLTNRELRDLYMKQIIEPTFAISEAHFRRQMAKGKVNADDIPLTMRAISGMFLGLLLLRIMGDTYLESHWDAVPDLFANLLLDGIDKTE
jgi:TetR/AcrR family fatty acid metabolism transcriptional regulator